MGNCKEMACAHESGVYVIMHTPTQSGYVGSSFKSIYNRWSWHKSKLKYNSHTCAALQELWNKTDSEDWEFIVLEEDENNEVREREEFWMGYPKVLLNTIKDPTGTTRRHSPETIEKMRAGRARYLETPGARESLSIRAKIQRANGNLGRRRKES